MKTNDYEINFETEQGRAEAEENKKLADVIGFAFAAAVGLALVLFVTS